MHYKKKADRSGSFVGFKPNVLGLKESRGLEWIIPNGLGGYSSSTIINMNTSRNHGLLVSSDEFMNKRVLLQKLDEELIIGDESISLASDMYEGGNVSDGWRFLQNFDLNYSKVFFDYSVLGVKLTKSLKPIHGRNAVIVSYEVYNKRNEGVRLKVTPYMNMRDLGSLGRKSPQEMRPRLFSEHIAGIDSSRGYLTLCSDLALCSKKAEDERWNMAVYYPKENVTEPLCSPLYFSLDVEPKDMAEFTVTAVGYDNEEKTAKVFSELLDGKIEGDSRIFSSGKGESIMSLLNSVDYFILDSGSKKTIASSYPFSGDRGREAMISLPGFTLINRRYQDAESIMEHYLNCMDYRGIPSEFINGKPVYGDVDTPLWLIDRFHRYLKCVGPEDGVKMLHTYWWGLKNLMKKYAERERDGLLHHKGGTWMDSKHIKRRRVDAVEVQGLWYNALNVMRGFHRLMEDDSDEIGYDSLIEKFEENFVDRYWRGRFLADSAVDDALRPNQLITISLEFNVVNKTLSKKILNAVDGELLTSFGLRTLSPADDRYVGNWDRDLKNKFNGNVYTWLMGAYIDAFIKNGGEPARAQKLLEPLFRLHMQEAALGTVSELFAGDPPNRPGGNPSYSCSIAELLRVHFEHIVGFSK